MRHILNLICLLIFMVLSEYAYAQVRHTSHLKPEKKYRMISSMMEEGSYYNVSEELEQLIAQHKNNNKYLGSLATSYFLARDYVNAERVYKELTDLDNKNQTLARFRYATCLKYNAKYQEAQSQFEIFIKTNKYKDPERKPYKNYARQEVLSCKFAESNKGNNLAAMEVTHLGDRVNSAYSDFAPYLKGDTLIFSSHQKDSVIEIYNNTPHTEYVRLYSVSAGMDGWENLEPLPSVLDNDYMNTANAVFSPDRQRLYYTRCYPVKGSMHCSIYMSKLQAGKYSKPVKLGNVNGKYFTATQPHVVLLSTEKTPREVLLYASDRKGGVGGMDIWYSYLDKDGYPGKPVNAGRTINSIRNEITPFYEPEKQVLYFSSDFHEGFGGYDIFRSKGDIKNKKWTVPQNPGQPVNSSADDTYFRWADPKERLDGFLVSNRPGGLHLTSETCCDDIYRFHVLEIPEEVATEVPKDPIQEEDDSIPENAAENEETYTCSRLGKDIRLKDRKGLKIILNYDFNDTDFIERHREDLDCMVELLNQYKDIQIKVTAHTDNVGSEQYNLKLSKRRAHSIQTYLIKQGISATRIYLEYFGESRPLLPNDNTDGSPNEDNRALNRRSEIIIIN